MSPRQPGRWGMDTGKDTMSHCIEGMLGCRKEGSAA